MYDDPSVDDFKAYFLRDFPYGSGFETVTDQDIFNALTDAKVLANPALAADQAQYTLFFLLLAAHYLVVSLRASSQGIAGQYTFLQNQKSAGNVSEAFGIPQRVLDNPQYSMLVKTNYGAKYIGFVWHLLSAQIFTVCGATHP